MPTMNNTLDIKELKTRIAQQPLLSSQLGEIHYFQNIDSTNKWLLENGNCGDICLSEMQQSGRGRRGNSWLSPQSGNIYFSLCYCLDKVSTNRSLIGLVVGICVAEALQLIGLQGHGVKWPNDIFWKNKKLGGILIETSNQSKKLIIGIGLNVKLSKEHQAEVDQEITSLDKVMESGSFTREQLIYQIIDRLFNRLHNFSTLNFADFIVSWKKWDVLLGDIIQFKHKGSLISGKVTGIDKHGRISVEHKNEETVHYSSIDIIKKKCAGKR